MKRGLPRDTEDYSKMQSSGIEEQKMSGGIDSSDQNN